MLPDQKEMEERKEISQPATKQPAKPYILCVYVRPRPSHTLSSCGSDPGRIELGRTKSVRKHAHVDISSKKKKRKKKKKKKW